jgi:hypothetical protein
MIEAESIDANANIWRLFEPAQAGSSFVFLNDCNGGKPAVRARSPNGGDAQSCDADSSSISSGDAMDIGF